MPQRPWFYLRQRALTVSPIGGLFTANDKPSPRRELSLTPIFTQGGILMLVLTRKKDESVVIGNRVTVRILRLKGNVVRVGIEAPADVHIRRSELLEKPLVQEIGCSQTKPLPG
jgi:carbon storage regulator